MTNPEAMRRLHDDFRPCAACTLPSSCRSALHCANVKRVPSTLQAAVNQMQRWAEEFNISPAELLEVFHNGISATPSIHDRVKVKP